MGSGDNILTLALVQWDIIIHKKVSLLQQLQIEAYAFLQENKFKIKMQPNTRIMLQTRWVFVLQTEHGSVIWY